MLDAPACHCCLGCLPLPTLLLLLLPLPMLLLHWLLQRGQLHLAFQNQQRHLL